MSRPWREVKSRRGAPKRIDTQGYACPNPQCRYFGIAEAHLHAPVGDGKHGHAERIQTFRCQACRTTFSARRDTPMYRLKPLSRAGSPWCSLLWPKDWTFPRPPASQGSHQATITTWLTRAGSHAQKLHKHSFSNLQLPHVQLDELRTRLCCAQQIFWLWLAIDSRTKILPVTRARSAHPTHGTSRRSFPATPLGRRSRVPLFTNDGLNLYFYALTAHLGHWREVVRCGRNILRWQVAEGLIYGQVKKS